MTDDLGIAWFRRDLRLDDNPAWAAATAGHGRVLALYVIDPALLEYYGRGVFRARIFPAKTPTVTGCCSYPTPPSAFRATSRPPT